MQPNTQTPRAAVDQLFLAEKYQDALALIMDSTEWRHTPDAQLIQAICLTRLGAIHDADAIFISLIQSNPTQLRYKLAHLELLGRSPVQHDRLRSRCSEIIARSPGHPIAHYYLGLAEFELDNYKDAVKHFQAALTKHPNNPHYMTLTARAALGTGDIDGAIKWFSAAHALAPDQLDTLIYGAEALLINGETDQAVTWSERVTILAPESDDAWFRLGLARLSNRDPIGAAAAFTTALTIKPDSVEYTYYVGHAHLEKEAYDTAIEFLTTRPESIQSALMILCLTGTAYQKKQSPKQAAHYFEKAHHRFPDSPIPFVHQSGLMHAHQRYEASLKHAHRALSIDNRLAEAHFRKAEALSALQQVEADQSYQTAIGIEPYNPKTYLAYAEHLIRSQNPHGASQVLDTVITMFPKFTEAQTLRDSLT